ncbi:MAG TPA: HAD family hydrolase [Propionibacteriaceae bacterium]|nr:HAD family hydrolase [Propionibacteriaceae bacterium]
MLPALIATDLDGTLLGPDGRVSAGNAGALWRAHRLGVPIAITTGRPLRWLADLEPIAATRPHVICSNGAVRVDIATGAVERRHVVPPPVGLEVVAELREQLPDVSFAVEAGPGWGCEPSFPLRGDGLVPDVVAPIEELLHLEVVKLLVVSPRHDSDALAEALIPVVAERLTATWSMTGSRGLLEIGPPGVSKASALRELCDELGVAMADVVAFGDMPNDLAMLREVGHPYAMANGHPALHAEGFPIAPHHGEDGVAQVLARVLDAIASPPGQPA